RAREAQIAEPFQVSEGWLFLDGLEVALERQDRAPRVEAAAASPPAFVAEHAAPDRHRRAAVRLDVAAVRDHLDDVRRRESAAGAFGDAGQVSRCDFHARGCRAIADAADAMATGA